MRPPLEPLYLRGARERLDAPELDRLLGLHDADMQAIDQLQALRVRVDRGLAVLADRIEAARTFAARRARWSALAISGAAVVAISAIWLGADARPLVWIASVAVAVTMSRQLLLARRDAASLRELESRHRGRVDAAHDLAALAKISREIHADVALLTTRPATRDDSR